MNEKQILKKALNINDDHITLLRHSPFEPPCGKINNMVFEQVR